MSKIKLRDRLTPDKKGLFENRILTYVETLYENYPQPKCFTSHGIRHYKRVEARLNEIIPESIKSDLKEAEIFRLLSGVWFHDAGMLMGLFDGEKLISYTLSWIDETAAIVSIVATHSDYQNQGLATYLVNEAVQKLMEHTEIGLIHVRVDNPPAIKVYSKVGYEIYQTYLNVRL